MRKSLTLALAAVSLMIGRASADPLEDGVRSFRQSDYAHALASWRPLADQGNPIAQNDLGILYLDGKGVARDYVRAAQWFSASAAQGNSAGMYNLGLMYELGQGMKAEPFHAYMWYALAADQGDVPNAAAHRDGLWRRMTSAAQDEAKKLVATCKANNYHGCR